MKVHKITDRLIQVPYGNPMNVNKSEIMRAILAALAVTGIIVVAVTAPNVLSAFSKVYHPAGKYSSRQLNRSLRSLKSNGLIKISYKEKQTVIELTKNGRKKILKFELDNLQIKRPRRWDKKWRLVIFDVPEKNLGGRRRGFVQKLKELGFAQLQKSVWICPYPCEDEIDFLKEIYNISKFVRLVTATEIDIKKDLLSRFNLTV